jgi:hypothetical protein
VVRSLELEFRAEVRAREAKALCIVTELRCVGGGNEAQTMLLDSSSMQGNREEGLDAEEDSGEEINAAICVENSKESSRSRRSDHITTSLGFNTVAPPTASRCLVCRRVDDISGTAKVLFVLFTVALVQWTL